MKAAFLALLLSATASAKVCELDGLARVTIPEGADCAKFRRMFRAAVAELEALGLDPARLRSVRVDVRDASAVDCGRNGEVAGCYYDGRVTTSRMALSLLHELLHVFRPHHHWPKAWEEANRRFHEATEPLCLTPEDEAYDALMRGPTVPPRRTAPRPDASRPSQRGP